MKRLYVSNKDETARMFKSDLMEIFTKVHWTIPLILFVPVIGYLLFETIKEGVLVWWQILAWLAAGLFVWTITEYVLHRFIFHYELPGKWGQRIHFIFHGVHHDYPNDSWRLVMPPVVSIPLATLFYFLFKSLVASAVLNSFFAGFLVGYLCYDTLHYAIHHAPMNGKILMALKTHHLKHHFKDPDKGYGVSSPIWDFVIGTQFSKKDK